MHKFLANFTRSLIKRAVTWHRASLKRLAAIAYNAYQTDSYVADQAREHAALAAKQATAALKHSLAVDAAVDAELATLPECK